MSYLKKFLLTFPISLILLFNITPFSVSAYSYYIDVPYAEPDFSDDSGYFNFFFLDDKGDVQVYNFYWNFFNSVNSSSTETMIDPFVSVEIDMSLSQLIFTFSGDPDLVLQPITYGAWSSLRFSQHNYPSVYSDFLVNGSDEWVISFSPQYITKCLGYSFKGNVRSVDYDNLYTSSDSFSVNFGSDGMLNDLLDLIGSEFLVLLQDSQLSLENQQIIISALNSSLDKLTSLDSKLSLVQDTLISINSILSEIETNTQFIQDIVDNLNQWLFEWSFTVDADHADIKSLLSDISSKLDKLISGPETYTESSTLPDNQNDFNRIEDELLNNDEVQTATDSISVEINNNAMSYIWDLVTSFLSSHPKIFGLIISILSLGIIALILNR